MLHCLSLVAMLFFHCTSSRLLFKHAPRIKFRMSSTNNNDGILILSQSVPSGFQLLWKTSNVFLYDKDDQQRSRRASKAIDLFVRAQIPSLGFSQRIHSPLTEATSGLVLTTPTSVLPSHLPPLIATYHVLMEGLHPNHSFAFLGSGNAVISSRMLVHQKGSTADLSLLEVKAPFNASTKTVMDTLLSSSQREGVRISPSSNSGLCLALVDIDVGSSALSAIPATPLTKFITDLHSACIPGITKPVLPLPTPAKMLKILKRDRILHQRLARDFSTETETGTPTDTLHEFCGLMLRVPPGSLVPKASSACLVDSAFAALERRVFVNNLRTGGFALDLGCGCGPLLLSLLHRGASGTELGGEAGDRLEGLGVDVDSRALEAAAWNAAKFPNAHFRSWDFTRVHEDEFMKLCQSTMPGFDGFDVVMCNPPYLAEHKVTGRVLGTESRDVLVGGVDGLDCYVEITRSLLKAQLRDKDKDNARSLLKSNCVVVFQLPGGENSLESVRASLIKQVGLEFDQEELGGTNKGKDKSGVRWVDVVRDQRGVRRAAILIIA